MFIEILTLSVKLVIFKGEIFCKFHEESLFCEIFTLEMFTFSVGALNNLLQFVKIFTLKITRYTVV